MTTEARHDDPTETAELELRQLFRRLFADDLGEQGGQWHQSLMEKLVEASANQKDLRTLVREVDSTSKQVAENIEGGHDRIQDRLGLIRQRLEEELELSQRSTEAVQSRLERLAQDLLQFESQHKQANQALSEHLSSISAVQSEWETRCEHRLEAVETSIKSVSTNVEELKSLVVSLIEQTQQSKIQAVEVAARQADVSSWLRRLTASGVGAAAVLTAAEVVLHFWR